MKSILDSGVTGILVSHSVDQVRELCKKILWLDHGNQIIFSDEVDLCCNAYEEFLYTKKVPKNREDLEQMAEDYVNRDRELKDEEYKKRVGQLEEYIANGDQEAIDAAIQIIMKNKPELLADTVDTFIEADD